MTTSGQVQQQVIEILQQESTLCHELIKALEDERTALERRDFDAFNQAVQSKQQCATELEHVENSLFHVMSNAGFSANRDGFKQFLESSSIEGEQSGIHACWDDLQNLMIECQKQNQVNGQIINVSMVNTQQALNILNGRDLHSSTYDQKGKTSGKDDNQKLAIA